MDHISSNEADEIYELLLQRYRKQGYRNPTAVLNYNIEELMRRGETREEAISHLYEHPENGRIEQEEKERLEKEKERLKQQEEKERRARAREEKCWVHPEVDAVAVCKSCARRVCHECALTIDGKTICKSCVESQPTRPRAVAPVLWQRTGTTTAAAILFFIIGIIGVIGSLLIMGLGGTAILLLGLVTFILSILHVDAGIRLWGNKKSGGILGIVLSIISFIFSVLLDSWIPYLILMINLIVLIAIGFDTLR